MQAIELFFDSNRGRYIPQNFVQEMDLSRWHGISKWAIETCAAGPDHEYYWEAWTDILDNATMEHEGHTYQLWQDGDVFLYCIELMTDEEKLNLFGDD